MRTDVGTVEDLHASAVKACGLDDFGGDDDNYIEALTVLLDAYRTEADLTEFGSKMQRFFARNALVARQAVRALEKHHDPEEGEGWAVRLQGVDELLAVSRRQLAAVREALGAG